MDLHLLLVLIIFIAAMSAFLNEKILKLNETTGFTIFSMLFSFIVVMILKISIIQNHGSIHYFTILEKNIKNIPFKDIVLNYFVGYLLFATTLHINVVKLKAVAKNISYLATIGVIISTGITGYLLYYMLKLFNVEIPFSACLIFGALISPTDSVSVIGVLKNNKSIPTRTQRIILGESLFNDATGILLLTIFMALFIDNGVIVENINMINYIDVLHILYNEVFLTLFLALSVGIIIGKLIIKETKNSSTALLITLFSAGLVYNICNIYHLSSPLAMVVLGLTIGHYLRESKVDNEKVEDFWTFIDDILNSFLFVLIGVKVLTININIYWLLLGILVIIITMLARYLSVVLPLILIKSKFETFNNINKKSILMTLGGVRGGISLALALSINGLPDSIIYLTYSIVVLSIVVQSYLFELYSNKSTINWE